jgi:two-component system CheB/CheR fusion protein
MQSLNEELQTINAELQSKLIDFENNDMKNLLNSTDIATLSRHGSKYSKVYRSRCKIFKLRISDVGKFYRPKA